MFSGVIIVYALPHQWEKNKFVHTHTTLSTQTRDRLSFKLTVYGIGKQHQESIDRPAPPVVCVTVIGGEESGREERRQM